jgi:hypothetical protein
MIVAPGTVRVTVAGQPEPLSLQLQMQPRNFTTAAPAAGPPVANRSDPGTCPPNPLGPSLNLPVPVVNAQFGLGQFCLEPQGGYLWNTVPADGPNAGIDWVSQIDPNDPLRWRYRWLIHPDADDLNCAFSLQQTGTYHQVNNPAGWISGPNLKTNAIRHESGMMASHYVQFVAANAVDNPGTAIESMLGSPADAPEVFPNRVNARLTSINATVGNATKIEPPSAEFDAAGNRQGYINYAAYGPGCHP